MGSHLKVARPLFPGCGSVSGVLRESWSVAAPPASSDFSFFFTPLPLASAQHFAYISARLSTPFLASPRSALFDFIASHCLRPCPPPKPSNPHQRARGRNPAGMPVASRLLLASPCIYCTRVESFIGGSCQICRSGFYFLRRSGERRGATEE